ncbi:MAG: hypothetical protein WBK77_06675 [Alphaproteobacteria bacterium]
MAEKKENKKKKENKSSASAAGKTSGGISNAQIFLTGGLIMAGVFYSVTTLLLVGMMPTAVAFIVDNSRAKTKVITVGAMNLAGCVPFLLELWTHGHSLGDVMKIIADPKAIVVMYSAAAIGYIIDWSLTSVIAAVLYQRGLARQAAIKKRQGELVSRWGEEVTGTIPLDEQGFAIEQTDKKLGKSDSEQ